MSLTTKQTLIYMMVSPLGISTAISSLPLALSGVQMMPQISSMSKGLTIINMRHMSFDICFNLKHNEFTMRLMLTNRHQIPNCFEVNWWLCRHKMYGRPQPQMYPPVALNQYTLVNRTHKHYIYMLQGPTNILKSHQSSTICKIWK